MQAPPTRSQNKLQLQWSATTKTLYVSERAKLINWGHCVPTIITRGKSYMSDINVTDQRHMYTRAAMKDQYITHKLSKQCFDILLQASRLTSAVDLHYQPPKLLTMGITEAGTRYTCSYTQTLYCTSSFRSLRSLQLLRAWLRSLRSPHIVR